MTEHEKALLESILHDSLIIDKYKIIPEMFYSQDGRNIFDAFIDTIKKGVKLDLISVSDTLREQKRDDLISIVCSLDPWTSERADYCVKILRDDMRRRSLKPIVSDAFNSLRDNAEIEVVLQKLSDGLVQAWQMSKEDEDPSIGNNFKLYVEELERRYNDKGKSGLRFGLTDIDSKLGANIGPGELIAIAARPGVGKTAIAIQFAVHNAIAQQIPATIFSLEMTRHAIYDRIFAQRIIGGLNLLKNGMIQSQKTRDDMEMLARELHMSHFRVFDRPMSPQAISAYIRRETLVYGTKLFVIDYLGLIDFSDDRKKPRWENVGDTTKMLKRLALDLLITIVICVQLTRDAEGKEPTLADLRDSGAIEQDCNRVFLLHRPSKEYAENTEIDLICAKNREGSLFKTALMFIGNKTKFEQMENRHE